MKRALILGITGQDGSYLAELLLEKKYVVYGLIRRKSRMNYGNIFCILDRIHIIDGDITDMVSLLKAIEISQPNEIYNLAAQSFITRCWQQPITTSYVNGLGVTNLLEAIRITNKNIKYYQASTSELYGMVSEVPQTEKTSFRPRNPYAIAKLHAHWMTVNYREKYNMMTYCGILFNHESERRGKEFVTRKTTDAIAKIKYGLLDYLELGNINAERDWGYAPDYVRAMWLMVQSDKPDDYVVATNTTHTVQEFVTLAFSIADIQLMWKHTKEGVVIAIDSQTNKILVKCIQNLYRDAEIGLLRGNPDKAKKF